MEVSELSFRLPSRLQRGESCLFDGPSVRLAFPPESILAVRRFGGGEVFVPGRDYEMTSDGLSAVPGGRLPLVTEAELHPSGSSAILYPAAGANAIGGGVDGRNLRFTGGDWYSARQVWVDYRAASQDFPAFPGPDNGFREAFARRLGRPEGLSVTFIGDSITFGCNASLTIGQPPHQPPYAGLVADALAARAAGPLAWRNRAVSGSGCRDALTRHADWQDDRPDLLVVAYGMNDFSSLTAQGYVDELGRILVRARERRPDTLVLFVASMAGNAAWQHTPPRPAAAFAEALRAFVSATPETGFADVYHVWEEMRGRKGYLSLTGNGVNHPNDYGYRLYAATLLNELLPGERLL